MDENTKCYYIETIKHKNTVIMVEPRRIMYVFPTLKNAYDVLGDNWNYIFFCGKSVYNEWKTLIPSYVKLVALDCDNLTPDEYNHLFKQRKFWEQLQGEFILTIQVDAWLVNEYPYTIDYFIKQDRSFIGGCMPYSWDEFKENGINLPYNNLNGGLSLRKRCDMIKAIDYMNSLNNDVINSYGEDVYLSMGCYKLNMKIGDDESTCHFAVHNDYSKYSFGLHNVRYMDIQVKIWHRYPLLFYSNPYIFFTHNELSEYAKEYCNDINITKMGIWQSYNGNISLQNMMNYKYISQ